MYTRLKIKGVVSVVGKDYQETKGLFENRREFVSSGPKRIVQRVLVARHSLNKTKHWTVQNRSADLLHLALQCY